MSDPFVAEIRIVAFNFAPTGWAQCYGQLMPISQNTALFSLLGTTYGGDGKSTFALPDFQGSAPMQQGQGPGLSVRSLGETGGETAVTLLTTEMAAHSHQAAGLGAAANTPTPSGALWAQTRGNLYAGSANTTMSPQSTTVTGGSQPHNNMSPYLVLNFIIALQGVYPPRG